MAVMETKVSKVLKDFVQISFLGVKEPKEKLERFNTFSDVTTLL